MDALILYIIGWIITIGIAIYAARSGAKDTAKKIAAIEENTNKQIESIKELEKIQLELSYVQAIKDLNEARDHYLQISQRSLDEDVRNHQFNQIGGPFEILRQREDRRRDLSDSQDFYAKQIDELQNAISQIQVLRKKLGEV